MDHHPFAAADFKVTLIVERGHPITVNVNADNTAGIPTAASNTPASFQRLIVSGAAYMTGIDLANIASPVQILFLIWQLDIIERRTKDIASESNIPQIPERIIVKGENNQNERTQRAIGPSFLDDTYWYSRYARPTSPKITGCFKRK
jgi:hypothetical protein